ncbi:MAG TPA: hypothetical protein VNX01_15975 [Bacteroidia bacterium]|nr:hypothetical protein [Bacteroidia bacterium]
MKKITALFFTLVFAIATTWAQNAKQSDGLLDGYFTVSTGLGVPIGNFGSNSTVNPNAYGAQTGVNFEMNYAARFSNYLGVAIMVRSVAVAHSVTSTAGYFDGNDPNYLWSAEATPDKIKMAMAGLYGTVPLGKKKDFMLFFKPMLGASFVAQTSTTYNLIAQEPHYSNGTITVTTGGQSYAFAYSFALGLKYNITPLFAFMAQVDYMSTNPMFNAQAVIATGPHIYYQDVTPYYLRMQMLSFNIGLALKVN